MVESKVCEGFVKKGRATWVCYAHSKFVGLARTVYIHHLCPCIGDFPAKNTVYTLYMYSSGQPYVSIDINCIPTGSSKHILKLQLNRCSMHMWTFQGSW